MHVWAFGLSCETPAACVVVVCCCCVLLLCVVVVCCGCCCVLCVVVLVVVVVGGVGPSLGLSRSGPKSATYRPGLSRSLFEGFQGIISDAKTGPKSAWA